MTTQDNSFDSDNILSELNEELIDFSLPSEQAVEFSDEYTEEDSETSSISSSGTEKEHFAPALTEFKDLPTTIDTLGDDEEFAVRLLQTKEDVDEFFHHRTFYETLQKYDIDRSVGDYVRWKYELTQLSFKEKLNVMNGDVSLSNLFTLLKRTQFRNIVACVGAGISVSAGIPDFRTPGTGLFDNLKQYNVPTPESIFEINFFKENPDPFYKLSKEIYPSNFKATPTHLLLKHLYDRGILRRVYTQNIDGLERIAGIPGEKLVEAHGTFATNHCIKCQASYSKHYYYDLHVAVGKRPLCANDGCGGLVKPDIVFYGEGLPKRFFDLREEDMKSCDLVLVMGTSLQVKPFADLPNMVPLTTPRVLVNRDVVGTFKFTAKNQSDNYRDVISLGDCDMFAMKAFKAIGKIWDKPLTPTEIKAYEQEFLPKPETKVEKKRSNEQVVEEPEKKKKMRKMEKKPKELPEEILIENEDLFAEFAKMESEKHVEKVETKKEKKVVEIQKVETKKTDRIAPVVEKKKAAIHVEKKNDAKLKQFKTQYDKIELKQKEKPKEINETPTIKPIIHKKPKKGQNGQKKSILNVKHVQFSGKDQIRSIPPNPPKKNKK